MRQRAVVWFYPLLILGLLIGCAPVLKTGRGGAVLPRPTVILGIFGGMGPEATANLYQLVVERTPATRDQEHIPTLIYSLPQVPDRTTAILSGDPSILPFLKEGVTRLEKAGASYIAIPCNTVHYYYDQMQGSVKIPIIHMIRETAEEVKTRYPQAKKVGLLATSGTISTGLYEKEFAARGIEVVVPTKNILENYVMKAVYLIKAHGDKQQAEEWLCLAGKELEHDGAEVVVLGCTEIPLAFNPKRSGVPVVSATRVLADRAIARYQEFLRMEIK
ncbi:MAG TPA: amino acid racemase [bacterium]|nr:amino acid racemase [bacterium]HQG45994.1 amino acid racemase [bacterium]HQI47368.1 amino acid racemase [bacterium]HQJ63030.1 amino acid racemase [bacterium]